MQKFFTNSFLILGGCYFLIIWGFSYCPPTIYTLWAQRIAFAFFVFYLFRLTFFFEAPNFVKYLKENWPKPCMVLVVLGCILYWRILQRLYRAAVQFYNSEPLDNVSGTTIMDKILSFFS